MTVTYFRNRLDGPEAAIEDAVACSVPNLFAASDLGCWMAGSLPVGAGMPDLAVVGFRPEVLALSDLDSWGANLLGYLRAVGRARLDTIAHRMRKSPSFIEVIVEELCEAQAIADYGKVFGLIDPWADILPEIVTVEAKVSDWRRAVTQASRNRVFSHRAFVALPDTVARRVQTKPIFGQLGIGIVAVSDHGEAQILRRSRAHRPRIWSYYYDIAFAVAAHSTGYTDGIRSFD